MAQYHAVVIGASGLIGWGVVNELLSQDSIAAGTFGRVTALINRPINRDDTFWPDKHPRQPKLLMVDRVNLMDNEDKITAMLKDRISDANTITHVYYFGEQRPLLYQPLFLTSPKSSERTMRIMKRRWK